MSSNSGAMILYLRKFNALLAKAREAELEVNILSIGSYEIKSRYGFAQVHYPESMTYVNTACAAAERLKGVGPDDATLVAFCPFVDIFLNKEAEA